MINVCDFSQYAKNLREMNWGNLSGLSFSMIPFLALALALALALPTTAGAAAVFGDEIVNPIEIGERTDMLLLGANAVITFLAATVGMNLIAFWGGALFRVASVWLPALVWLIDAGLGAIIFQFLAGRQLA